MRPAIVCAVAATLLGAACPAIVTAAPQPVLAPTSAPSDPWAAFDAKIAAAKAAMMASSQAALERSEEALAIARTQPASARRDTAVATGQWLQGEALLRLNRPEAAAPVLDQALAAAARAAPGSKLHGDLLMSRGGVSGVKGDVQAGLRDFQQAHDIFRGAGESRSQAMALQNIGSIYLDAKDYAKVLQYYTQSAEVFAGDPVLLLSAYNNRASALKEMGRLPEALAEFRLALKAARDLGSPMLEGRILTNLAQAEVLAGDLVAARNDVRLGLAAADRDAESADGWRPFLWGVQAQAELKADRPAAAAALLERTFGGQDLAATTMPFRDFHETAWRAYAVLGDQSRALRHLEAFKRLDDEGRTLAASTNAALMAARFDFANQDLKITRLKADQLEKDVKFAKARARLQAIIGGVLTFGGLIVVGLLSFGFLSIRRSRNEVRAANVELGHSNTALEKALQAKTEFLATTSHEIRTPLNGILGMTQVLLADRELHADQREKLQLLQGSGETMKALVDDLLDVAKMETGVVTVAREPMDLQRVLTESCAFWSAQAHNRGLTLTLAADAAPARIVEDEQRLRQVLFNLLSNAIKFTDAGGVTLRAEAAVIDGAERLRLHVVDTGIGVPADQQEVIFEAFKQVDGGVTRQRSGTGLGLAICRNVSRALGGDVTVVSAVDQGSTFTLDLPLERAAPAAQAAPARPTDLAGCDLLLVEANPLAASMLRAVLAPHAASVRVAPSVDAALQAVAEQPAHRFLAEGATLALAGDAVAEARRLVEAGQTSVSVLWTAPTPTDQAALLRAGVGQVLAKPIGAADLLAALRLACEAEPAAGPATEAKIASAPGELATAA